LFDVYTAVFQYIEKSVQKLKFLREKTLPLFAIQVM